MALPTRRRHVRGLGLLLAGVLAATAPVVIAQQPHAPRALTATDYDRAERFMPAATAPLVFRTSVQPQWLPDGRFWYASAGPDETTYVLVTPGRGTRAPAFNHAAVAASLSTALGRTVDAARLSLTGLTFGTDGRVSFVIDDRRASCLVTPRAGDAGCTVQPAEPAPPRPGGRGAAQVVSPDGRLAAFIRNHNLWVRELATGTERPLTTDGVEHFGYATNNAGWTRSDTPVVVWSPDSKRIATFQHDGRNVSDMYLVTTNVGPPTLQGWKYPLPGDEHIFMLHRAIIDVEPARVTRLLTTPDPHRSSLCDHVVCGGAWVDVQWSDDGQTLAYVVTSRDHRDTRLRVAAAATGEVREVLAEKVDTFFESGIGRVNWRYLPESNEAIWYSQRDNWGQLYLYDLTTGRLKNRITSGDGNVAQIVRLDTRNRVVYFTAMGKNPSRDPYFRHLYRVGFDGTDQRLLTPDDADHTIEFSPDGAYFIDTHSTPVTPPVATLRRADGRVVVELERADISKLTAAGWPPPMPFTVKARDGSTDLYGLLFRPTTFDPSRKYPIVNRIYPGPQSGSVGTRSFQASRSDAQALAELGFIVVSIDGMGTPGRSKTFHEAYYGNMGDNTLPDQVAGMQELARRFPWIDLDRAGVYGHSGGGYAAADAMFRYPDFFKVGVSQAGNHDNRNYEDDWAEKWQGLLVRNPDGTTNYDNQANQLVAKNLKGKLLLAHGTMDANVPLYGTLLVVDALIAANKDFDLILFPNRGHGFGNEPYMVRRRWDYFVRHLLGAEPPAGWTAGQSR